MRYFLVESKAPIIMPFFQIYLSAVDENGQWSKEVLLDIILRNAHERGSTDDFYVQCHGVLDAQEICLTRDSTFPQDHL